MNESGEDEDIFDIKEEKKEEIDINNDYERKDDDLIDYLNFTFKNVNKYDSDILKKEDLDLINKKRKRKSKKLKKIPVKLLKQKNRKPEPTIYQKIFNEAMKTDGITEDTVTLAASKFKYELTDENKKFFVELGKAKTSLKKYGLPSSMCKQPFHFFTYLYTYQDLSVVTDDYTTWGSYYGQGFSKTWGGKSLENYQQLCIASIIKEFSVITDKPMVFDKINYGYCQDFYKSATGITEKTFTVDDSKKFTNALSSNAPGTIKFDVTIPSMGTFKFYQWNSVIAIIKSEYNFNNALEMLQNTICYNSKNKLTSGMKDIKLDDKLGAYLNIHDMKLVDFSPSCLFLRPAAKGVKMFVKVDLETNQVFNYVYNAIQSKIKQDDKTGRKMSLVISMREVFPIENMVFWDNISSYVQMIGLIKFLLKDNLSLQLENEIVTCLDLYFKNRDVITAWKRVYKIFEGIVLGFYDRITTKLTIDGITSLKSKATDFILNYNYLKNDASYNNIVNLIQFIPGTKLMQSFILTSAPFEIVSSLLKLITILESGRQEKGSKHSIEDLFRTIGYMCIRTLFDEPNSMIPKIRSRAAFLGGPAGTMSNNTLNENIQYLVDAFKKKVIEKGDEGLKKRVLSYDEMDTAIEKVFANTLDKINDATLKSSATEILQRIRSDKKLYNSLREDIEEMLKNYESLEDIMAYGDFADNAFFNSFIKAFLAISTAFVNHTDGFEPTNVLSSMQVINEAPRLDQKYNGGENILKRKTIDLAQAPSAKMIEVQNTKLTKGVLLKKNHEMNQLENEYREYTKDLVLTK